MTAFAVVMGVVMLVIHFDNLGEKDRGDAWKQEAIDFGKYKTVVMDHFQKICKHCLHSYRSANPNVSNWFDYCCHCNFRKQFSHDPDRVGNHGPFEAGDR